MQPQQLSVQMWLLATGAYAQTIFKDGNSPSSLKRRLNITLSALKSSSFSS